MDTSSTKNSGEKAIASTESESQAISGQLPQPIVSGPKQSFPPVPHMHRGAPHFAFSRILLAFVILAVIAFSVLYAGIYMNLNEQVTRAMKVGQPSATAIIHLPTPTTIQVSTKIYIDRSKTFSLMYPPALTISENNSDPCVYFLDAKASKDIRDASGLNIQVCGFKTVMPTSFSYTNGTGKNDTVIPVTIHNYSGVQGEMTNEIGGSEPKTLLKNPAGGYLSIYLQTGDKAVYSQILSSVTFLSSSTQLLSPTCRPRPACLDTTPRCLIPETSDMCPKN